VGRAGRGERRNVRVLKANYIREFSVVSTGEDPLDPAGCVLDLDAIHAREEAALRCVNHSLFIWARELLYFGCLCLGCYNEWIIQLGDASTIGVFFFCNTSVIIKVMSKENSAI
jgi:hypothetical protein